MITTDLTRTKWNFWQIWIVANAIGFGFAWAIGEWLGQQAAKTLGWRFGQIIGIALFEGLLWIVRGAVLSRIKSYRALKPIEFIIWIPTEIMALILSELPVQENSTIGMMSGIIFATTIGATVWIALAFVKITKPKSKFWAIGAFLWTFFGFIGGTFLISTVLTISFWVNDVIAKMFIPTIGRIIAGALLGSLIGAITGIVLVKLIPWKNSDVSEYSI